MEKKCWHNDSEDSVGVSIEGAIDNIITCNNIKGLNKNDSLYYFNNSTIRKFDVDTSNQGTVIFNQCYHRLEGGRLNSNSNHNCPLEDIIRDC
jgi:hypothetical protein